MIQVHAGHIIGRDHMGRQANAQDSYALAQTGSHVVGVVCDGCGSGHHSEVGAKLAAQYITGQAHSLLDVGMSPAEVVRVLYPSVTRFLNYITIGMQPVDRVAFVQHYLLFTVVGVIANEQEAVIFTAGDGLVAVDDTLTQIDQNNAPAYIAYHLLDANCLGGFTLPESFEVQTVTGWTRLAIASDGFEPELLPDVWGLKHPRALQRKLNVWSNMERRFRDDATIITLEVQRED